MENTSLASEILAELKMSAKRWFIAFCIMVVLEVITIAGFLYYIHYYNNTNTIKIENARGNSSYIGNDLIGELNNGYNTSYEDEKSSKK